MTIIENADLKLSLTIYADDTLDLATLLREVAGEIKRGSLAGNGGGCIGSYVYIVEEQTRAPELPDEADKAGSPIEQDAAAIQKNGA